MKELVTRTETECVDIREWLYVVHDKKRILWDSMQKREHKRLKRFMCPYNRDWLGFLRSHQTQGLWPEELALHPPIVVVTSDLDWLRGSELQSDTRMVHLGAFDKYSYNAPAVLGGILNGWPTTAFELALELSASLPPGIWRRPGATSSAVPTLHLTLRRLAKVDDVQAILSRISPAVLQIHFVDIGTVHQLLDAITTVVRPTTAVHITVGRNVTLDLDKDHHAIVGVFGRLRQTFRDVKLRCAEPFHPIWRAWWAKQEGEKMITVQTEETGDTRQYTVPLRAWVAAFPQYEHLSRYKEETLQIPVSATSLEFIVRWVDGEKLDCRSLFEIQNTLSDLRTAGDYMSATRLLVGKKEPEDKPFVRGRRVGLCIHTVQHQSDRFGALARGRNDVL